MGCLVIGHTFIHPRLLLLLLLLLYWWMMMVIMTFVQFAQSPVNHVIICLSLSPSCIAIVDSHSFTVLPVSIVSSSSSSSGRSLSPPAATRRPVGMATLPNSAGDWSRASQWRQWRQTRSSSPRRDINAVGKSRQISLGRSNLSFIARINVAAQWTERHPCRSSNIRNISSSSISSKYSMPNVCMYISILALHLRQLTQPQSRQVSLVTNQISRSIFAPIRSFTRTWPSHAACARRSPPHGAQYSIISNFISSRLGVACQ